MSLFIGPRIITQNLVLCYDFGNSKSYPGSGSSVKNLARNANHGTLIASPTYNSTNGGQLILNGSSQYITLSRPAEIIAGGRITIALFIKWTGLSIQTIFDNDHNPGKGFAIKYRGDLAGTPTTYLSNGTAEISSSTSLSDGNWIYLVSTNNTTTSRLYSNGVENVSGAGSGPILINPTITIGCWLNSAASPARFVNGSIGSVQMYDRDLSTEEINQNYDALKRRFLHI